MRSQSEREAPDQGGGAEHPEIVSHEHAQTVSDGDSSSAEERRPFNKRRGSPCTLPVQK